MLSKLLAVAVPLALPTLLAAQAPTVPHGKATRTRGEVVAAKEDKDRDRDDRSKQEDKDRDRDDRGRNPNAATPAIPAHGEGPAVPAKPGKGDPHRTGSHRP